MDPERIHAYLQAACSGLGFDIGEVWFSSREGNGTETVSSFGQRNNVLDNDRRIKFLQLYTSKSFNSRRNDLLKPETETIVPSGNSDSSQHDNNKNQSIEKHVLSPLLVNAIAQNAQVVWANCQKQEGLLGRSDMRLQTAVGMPVAMDKSGNMCIVVMFSPRNITSSQDAIDFIKLISQSAANTRIPCLLPVVDSDQHTLAYNPKQFREWEQNETHVESSANNEQSNLSQSDNIDDIDFDSNDALNELALLPKDQYGIPILPEFAELNTDGSNRRDVDTSSSISDDVGAANEFDSATYGLWSTIMNSPQKINSQIPHDVAGISHFDGEQSNLQQVEYIQPERKERLEEFVSAFLGLSVFDIADVWVPISVDANGSILLHNVFAISSNESSSVTYFKNISRQTIIKGWSGAVGRAQCSGNPVWSTNPDIIADDARRDAFITSNIKTALAVPIFSNSTTPTCVLSCYSMVRSDSETFVLKFLQQALRTLWAGLDNIEPHESIGPKLWKGVSAADLGEMAADTEMQKAFYTKKRPYQMIANTNSYNNNEVKIQLKPQVARQGNRPRTSSLAMQLQSISEDHDQQSSHYFHPTYSSQHPQNVQFPTNNTPRFSQDSIHNSQQSSNKLVNNNVIHPMQNIDTTGFEDDQNAAQNIIDVINSLVQKSQKSDLPPKCKPMAHSTSNVSSEPTIPSGMIICAPVTVVANNVPSTFPSEMATSSVSSKCRIEGCDNESVSRRPYCSRHSGNRICEYKHGCTKCAQGATRYCIAHGGGRRCIYPGCDKGARDKFHCAAHGGGKRCSQDGCSKSAVGGSSLCTSHGGGRRCTVEGCNKSAQSSTRFCVKHGGGKKCSHEGCIKVARGRTMFCAGHGGGVRCKIDGCSRIAIGKLQLCRSHGGGSSIRQAKVQNVKAP